MLEFANNEKASSRINTIKSKKIQNQEMQTPTYSKIKPPNRPHKMIKQQIKTNPINSPNKPNYIDPLRHVSSVDRIIKNNSVILKSVNFTPQSLKETPKQTKIKMTCPKINLDLNSIGKTGTKTSMIMTPKMTLNKLTTIQKPILSTVKQNKHGSMVIGPSGFHTI